MADVPAKSEVAPMPPDGPTGKKMNLDDPADKKSSLRPNCLPRGVERAKNAPSVVQAYKYLRTLAVVVAFLFSATDPLRVLFSYWTVSNLKFYTVTSSVNSRAVFAAASRKNTTISFLNATTDTVMFDTCLLTPKGAPVNRMVAGTADVECFGDFINHKRYLSAQFSGLIYISDNDQQSRQVTQAARTVLRKRGFRCHRRFSPLGDRWFLSHPFAPSDGSCQQVITKVIADRQTVVDFFGRPCTPELLAMDQCLYKTVGYIINPMHTPGAAEYHEWNPEDGIYEPTMRLNHGPFAGAELTHGNIQNVAATYVLGGLFTSDYVNLALSRHFIAYNSTFDGLPTVVPCLSSSFNETCAAASLVKSMGNSVATYPLPLLAYGVRVLLIAIIFHRRLRYVYMPLWQLLIDPSRRMGKTKTIPVIDIIAQTPITNPNFKQRTDPVDLALNAFEVYFSIVDILIVYTYVSWTTESLYTVKTFLKFCTGARLVWVAALGYWCAKTVATMVYNVVGSWLRGPGKHRFRGTLFHVEDMFLVAVPWTIFYLPPEYKRVGRVTAFPNLYIPLADFDGIGGRIPAEMNRADNLWFFRFFVPSILFMTLTICIQDAILEFLHCGGVLSGFMKSKTKTPASCLVHKLRECTTIDRDNIDNIHTILSNHILDGVVTGVGLLNANLMIHGGWLYFNRKCVLKYVVGESGRPTPFGLRVTGVGQVEWMSIAAHQLPQSCPSDGLACFL